MSVPQGPPRSLRYSKIAALVVLVAVLVIAQRLGVFRQFDNPAQLTETLRRLGPWGYVTFVVVYAALQPFGIPGTVFVIAASLVWPWPIAFGLSMTGTMASSVVGFSFARFIARDWISTQIPARFRKYDDALAQRGLATVIVLRLAFWMQPMLHAFFGVSKVRFWTHFWGSLVGYVLPLLLVSYFGQRLFDGLKAAPLGVWLAIGAGVAVVTVALWAHRRRRRAPEV